MNNFPCMTRSLSATGEARFALGEPLVDSYPEFVAGRTRPNTLRAVAFDLKTFFTVVRKDPVAVVPADVFKFLADQRGDRSNLAWPTVSRDSQPARSPGVCPRCPASMPTWWPEATRRSRPTRCLEDCRPDAVADACGRSLWSESLGPWRRSFRRPRSTTWSVRSAPTGTRTPSSIVRNVGPHSHT